MFSFNKLSHYFRSPSNNKICTRARLKLLPLGILIIFLVDHFGLLLHFFEVDFSNKFSYPLDMPLEELLLALKKSRKPSIPPINEYSYRFKIKNEKKCKQEVDHIYDNVVLVYLIKSAITHQNRRDGIRKSWGWENRFSDVVIRRIFIVGTSLDSAHQDLIDEEYARYKDIVQADFYDAYYNNTIKTMMGFKWVVQNCPKAQFILFADDDMYISTKNLLKFIRNPFDRQIGFRKRRSIRNISIQKKCLPLYSKKCLNPFKTTWSSMPLNTTSHQTTERKLLESDSALSAFDGRLLAGYVFYSSPMRHKSSKWYITLSEYPYSKYPPYVTAGAYVLSYPALIDMYYTSMYTKHFKFDDVYLGIVAKKCGITPIHNKNFYFWKKTYGEETYSDVIASHGYDDPDELRRIWEEQRSSGHA